MARPAADLGPSVGHALLQRLQPQQDPPGRPATSTGPPSGEIQPPPTRNPAAPNSATTPASPAPNHPRLGFLSLAEISSAATIRLDPGASPRERLHGRPTSSPGHQQYPAAPGRLPSSAGHEDLPIATFSSLELVAIKKMSEKGDSKLVLRIADVNDEFSMCEHPADLNQEIDLKYQWGHYFICKGFYEVAKLKGLNLGAPVGLDVVVDGIVPSGSRLLSSVAFVYSEPCFPWPCPLPMHHGHSTHPCAHLG